MPIRPERAHLYPGGSVKSPEWRAIRKRIGERSGWRCETCGAPHMTIVARGSYGGRDAYMVVDTGEVFDAETGLKMATMKLSAFDAPKKAWRRKALDQSEQVTCYQCKVDVGVETSAVVEMTAAPRRRPDGKKTGGKKSYVCVYCLTRGKITKLIS